MVSAEDRTAYFLGKLEAMWPNRLALSVKETAETLNVMLGVKHGAGAEELVRRAIKSGRLIPGLGRPAGRQWRIPLYDLAHHFGHGFQPADLATTKRVASSQCPAVPTLTPLVSRRGKAAIIPSTFVPIDGAKLRSGLELWQWAEEPRSAVRIAFGTKAQEMRNSLRRERNQQFWADVGNALARIRAHERAEQALVSGRPSRRRSKAGEHRS